MQPWRKIKPIVAGLFFLIILIPLVLTGCGDDDDDDDDGDDITHRYEFRSTSHGMEIRINGDEYKSFFPMGINFGLTVPGKQPGEHSATADQIARWIEAAAEMGTNVIRVYTVQNPEFYQQLREYNLVHQDNPMFLLHGAWLKEPTTPVPDYLSDDIRNWFIDELGKVVDVVHGNRDIPPGSEELPDNWGRAFGLYEADVSPWLLGWLVGREIEPITIMNSHALHPDLHAYYGTFFYIEDGSPIETFIVENLDYLITYEEDNYAEQHTIGFSNWPTLDPLVHYTEPPFPASSEEMFSIDIPKMGINEDVFNVGVFISYHAYPYYPDYILFQPEYQIEDSQGINSYLGYLMDLRAYYEDYTLFIAETGIPSSQGCAHYASSGMNHGGFDEVGQGYQYLREVETILEAGLDGIMLFSIIDEWFKRAWIVDQVDFPGERRAKWHNTMSPEQNFGLIALKPGPENQYYTIDGYGNDWITTPQAEKDTQVQVAVDEYDPMRNIKSLTISHDEGFLYLKLELENLDPDGNGDVEWDEVNYLFAIDTIDPERGDSALDPDGIISVENRVEFLLEVNSSAEVNLYVDRPYDLYGIWFHIREEWQKYRTFTNDDGLFEIIRTITNAEYIYNDMVLGEQIEQITGELPVGNQQDNSLTNFWYSIQDNILEIRLPFNLLNFVDPADLQVVDGDNPDESDKQLITTSETGGLTVMAVALAQDGDATTFADSLPQADVIGDYYYIPAQGSAAYIWNKWEMPTFHEYRKASFYILQEELPAVLPDSAYLP